METELPPFAVDHFFEDARLEDFQRLAGRELVNARLRRKITGTRAKTTDPKTEKKRAYFCCIGKGDTFFLLVVDLCKIDTNNFLAEKQYANQSY